MISCPQCGKLNPENFNYCLDCGAELHPETTHSAESQFFIDLSADSPDVKKAKAEAEKTKTPKPEIEEKAKAVEETPRKKVDQRLRETPLPDGGAIELSPEDLLDEIDEPLDAPASANAASTPPKPIELSEPEPYDSEAGEPDPFELEELPGDKDDAEALLEVGGVDSDELLDEHGLDDMVEFDDNDDADEIRFESANEDEAIHDEPLEVDMSQVEEPRCWKCGAELTADDKFCGQCGTPVGERPDDASGKTMFMHVGTSDSLDSQLVGKLTILEPSGKEGRSFNLVAGENLCGRTSDPVLLDDKFISPTHCSFIFDNDKMLVKDLESYNGVYIKVKGEVALGSGDRIRIGQQLFEFKSVDDFAGVDAPGKDDDTAFYGSPVNKIWGKLLHVTKEGRVLAHLVLDKPNVIIGREQGDIVFHNDGFISGTHAKLSLKEGKAVLTDLGSSNGTYVRVDEYGLNNNDMVLVGKKLLRFEFV